MITPAHILNGRLPGGMSYAEYEQLLVVYAARRPEDAASEEDREHILTGPLNLQRSSRIRRTYAPSADILRAVERVNAPQTWMVLSEPWCGDSAQCVPYIAGIAGLSGSIDLRIFLRDANPDLMDLCLTGGKRSIPKLMAFDASGEELFRWGPRPREAQELVDRMLGEGVEKRVRLERLHRWYGKNRGRAIEEELLQLLLR